MRITHLCLACFFPDGYAYQENMLPKYHRLQGHEVTVIASQQSFDESGKTVYPVGEKSYRNEHDVLVHRLDYSAPARVYRKLKRFRGLTAALQAADPEILFIHGCQFLDMDKVVRWIKAHPGVKVFVDNHADLGNSAMNWASMHLLHKLLWKRCAGMIEPYTEVFYGVTPSRVEFLQEIYGIPASRTELLVMGADDEAAQAALDPEVRSRIRRENGIAEEDFLLVTGGKINHRKQQTMDLMRAVNRLADPRVKLLIFGSVSDELKEAFAAAMGPNIRFVGWIPASKAFEYFAAGDLAVFPGAHSVIWEQVAGLGKPMLCSSWVGTSHLDLGGNVRFLKDGNEEELLSVLRELREDPAAFEEMERIAAGAARDAFSYSDIAKRSIRL